MGLLGTMTVRFGADISGLSSGMAQAKNIFSSFPKNPMKLVEVGLLAAGAAVVGFAASSVSAASNFQQSMLKVQAYAGLSKSQVESMSNSILNMATTVGQSPKALADALYPIISAGYGSADALNILKLSAETAAASGADTSKVADGLTTALKAMGAPASMAGQYMDIINKTTAQGKMEIPGYAAVIGKLSLSASGAKVPFVDMNAALATLTTHGFPSVAQASTSLGNLFTQIGVKTANVEAAAKKLKISFDAQKFSTMSLGDKIAYLNNITGGNQNELLKLVGGSTLALKAFDALSTGSDAYKNNLTALQHASGATNNAFQTADSGFNASQSRVQAAIGVLQVKLGSALLPALTSLMNAVAPLITNFANWAVQSNIVGIVVGGVTIAVNILKTAITVISNVISTTIGIVQNITNWLNQHHTAVLAVAGAITLFFLPALISAGVSALTSGAQIAGTFIASMVSAGAEAVTQGAIMTAQFVASVISAGASAWVSAGQITGSFVVAMVSAGAAAIKQAAQVTGSFVASLVETGSQAIWAALQVTGSFIVSMVSAGVQAAITAGTFLATLIPAIVSFAAEALTAAATAIPAILVGFGAWVVGAAAVAIANIAAFWPIYLIVLVIIGVIALVVLAVKNWGAIVGWLQGVWSKIATFFNTVIIGPMKYAFSQLGTFIQNVWSGIQAAVKNAINFIIGGINNFIGFIDGIQIHIPAVGVGPVQTPAMNWNGVGIPKIPYLANGGRGLSAGYKIVGERGPEMLYTGQGSSVYSNRETSNMLGGGGDHYTVIELDGNVLTTAVSKRQAKMTRVRMARRAA